MRIAPALLLFGYVCIINGQSRIGLDSTFVDSDVEFGLFEGQLVDIGSLTGVRVGRMGAGLTDSYGGLRGGTFGGVGRGTDFIAGLRQCRFAICTQQWIPRRCRYTPVRRDRFGGYCSDCPIDICEIDSGTWRPRRRRRMRRIRRFLCRVLGICRGPWRGWGRGRGRGRGGFGGGCRGGFDCVGGGRGPMFGGGCRGGLDCPGFMGRGRGLGRTVRVL